MQDGGKNSTAEPMLHVVSLTHLFFVTISSTKMMTRVHLARVSSSAGLITILVPGLAVDFQ
jgi:hypothetical protein